MNFYACLCGCRSESEDPDPPKCWGCGERMYLWRKG